MATREFCESALDTYFSFRLAERLWSLDRLQPIGASES